MKLTKEQILKYIKIFEEYKSYIGLSDWNIKIAEKLSNKDKVYAEITPDILEKVMLVQLNKTLFELSEIEQNKVLLHELIHARVLLVQLYLEEHQMVFEEHLVNDLVRGFEKFGFFK